MFWFSACLVTAVRPHERHCKFTGQCVNCWAGSLSYRPGARLHAHAALSRDEKVRGALAEYIIKRPQQPRTRHDHAVVNITTLREEPLSFDAGQDEYVLLAWNTLG